MDEPKRQFEGIKIHENSVESQTIMEGFIGLPKDNDTSEGLGENEAMQFEHGDEDCSE